MSDFSRDLAIPRELQVKLESSIIERGLALEEDIARVVLDFTRATILNNRLLLVEWPVIARVSKRYNEVWSTSRMRRFGVHTFSIAGEYIDSNYFSLISPHDVDMFIDEGYSSLNIVDNSLSLYETSGFLELDDDPSEEVIAHIFDLSGKLKAVLTNTDRIASHLPQYDDIVTGVDRYLELPSELGFGRLARYSVKFFPKESGSLVYVSDNLPWLASFPNALYEQFKTCLHSRFHVSSDIRTARCDESGIWIQEKGGMLVYRRIETESMGDPTSEIATLECNGHLLEFYRTGSSEVLALDRSMSANTLPLLDEGRFTYFYIGSQQQIGRIEIHLQEMIRDHVVSYSENYSYSIEDLYSTHDLSNGILSFSADTSMGIPCVGTINLHSGEISAFIPKVPRARRVWSEDATTVWVDD